jgi:hypothetical protein
MPFFFLIHILLKRDVRVHVHCNLTKLYFISFRICLTFVILEHVSCNEMKFIKRLCSEMNIQVLADPILARKFNDIKKHNELRCWEGGLFFM